MQQQQQVCHAAAAGLHTEGHSRDSQSRLYNMNSFSESARAAGWPRYVCARADPGIKLCPPRQQCRILALSQGVGLKSTYRWVDVKRYRYSILAIENYDSNNVDHHF
jgi:hypothetical protein